jgi:beta-phosphoglucomutase-like phosphatase (HAD superfamily)
MTFDAVLSDLDGVLVDSGDAVERVALAATHDAAERGAAAEIYSNTRSISSRISTAASWMRAAKSRRS